VDSWFFLSFPRYIDSVIRGSGRDEEPAGTILRLIRIRLATPSLAKITPASQAGNGACNLTGMVGHGEFHKRSQHFIGTHDKALSVAMRFQPRKKFPGEATA